MIPSEIDIFTIKSTFRVASLGKLKTAHMYNFLVVKPQFYCWVFCGRVGEWSDVFDFEQILWA